MVRSIIGLLAALTLISCETPPELRLAERHAMVSGEPWSGVDAGTGQLVEIAELTALAENFPNSSSVRLRLLGAHFRGSDVERVIEQVEWLTSRGYIFSDAGRGQLLALAQETHAAPMEAALGGETQPIVASTQYFEVPAEIRLPEAALYDPKTQRLFVTSFVSRGLFVSQAGSEFQEVPLPNIGSVAGIVLDETRGLIWIASGIVDPTPDPETAFAGVIALDRETLEERRRLAAPNGVTVSDIAVGPDGTVYASDPVNGGIWVASMENRAMWSLVPPGTFRSPQGIAVRPDNAALYVSDYRYGIALVTLPARDIYRVRADDHILLDGVDGLWLHENRLVAVQNGLSPHRISAFELGDDIDHVKSRHVFELANPEWTEPLGGAISGGTLYYIGTGQWDVYGEGGALLEGMSPRPAQVRALELVETPAQLP